MKTRLWVLAAAGLAGALPAFGQATQFRDQFRQLVSQDKYKEAATLVQRWEQAQPRDPDAYVADFNLLVHDAEAIALSGKPAAAGEMSVSDPKTGQAVGSIGPSYDLVKLQHAMDVLRKGLAVAPDRLDIRFGLAKTAEYRQDAAQQYQVLSEALAWRKSAAGKPWRWRDGGPLPAPEDKFVPGSLEEYMVPYWQSDTREGLERALAITELLLKYYPGSSLGYFNKGNYYAFTNQDAEAYAWFVKADKIDSHDPQNINNLLRLSLNLKNKAAAQGYLPRLCAFSDFKAECQHYTEELRKL